MDRPAHNFGLDLVRSGAILAVLFSHTGHWWLGPGQQSDIQAGFIGRAGVEAFFSLSGFLIGGILLRLVHDAGLRGSRFGLRDLGLFWTRRWMRTLPAYWVMILALNWHFGTSDWRSMVFVQNFVPRTLWTPLTPHTWSLALEEWFYLFVPLGLLAALAVLRRQWALPALCVALIAACTAGRALVGTAPDPFWGPEPAVNPILRLDCAAWGVLAACLVRRGPVSRGVAVAALVTGVAMLTVLGIVSAMLFEPERLVPWGIHWWAAAWAPLHPALEELAAACIVVGLHRLAPRGPGMLAVAAGVVAALSYSLYLVHVPVVYLSRAAGLDDAVEWGPRLAIVALVAGAAVAMRYGVERPALALRDWLAPDRRVSASPAASASARIAG